METNKRKIFDSHLHIIDSRFPLIANNGYLPNEFTCDDYLNCMEGYQLIGGAIVSGSFQSFDQTYLINALQKLGSSFVGVTQLPENVSDEEIIRLDNAGIRAIRFNIFRGGSENIKHLDSMALRVYELVNWHVELYVDSKELDDLYSILSSLPKICIDHLGFSKEGFNTVLKLAEQGCHIKVTGFGRVNFDIPTVLVELNSANPESLVFGTDLPSTRAKRPYRHSDCELVIESLGEKNGQSVLYENAIHLYRPMNVS